jgi:DNA-binding CsgD family transcriptional regulator
MLFEELSEKFGCQVVEPFKEPVIIVDSKDFRKEWEEQLKSEGCKILVSDFLGRSCFLIRKPQASNNSAGEQPTPQPSQPQNIEEAIIQLIREGKTFKEIRESLSLSHAQLMGYLSHLRKKGVLNKVGWVPARRRHLKKSHLPNAISEVKPFRETNLDVKELLEVSLMLLDSYPKVVRFLLQKCMESLP